MTAYVQRLSEQLAELEQATRERVRLNLGFTFAETAAFAEALAGFADKAKALEKMLERRLRAEGASSTRQAGEQLAGSSGAPAAPAMPDLPPPPREPLPAKVIKFPARASAEIIPFGGAVS